MPALELDIKVILRGVGTVINPEDKQTEAEAPPEESEAD